ncbi:hypothetical protein GCM10027290_07690 [Micromonospora sonneratiae]|uniref:hypothetical protein n=1 Tax=Micromonospora sonneratiae TaxID=1184706 RepID=UPI003672BE4B
MNDSTSPMPGKTRHLWLAVAGLFSLVVALLAGILESSTGAGLAGAVKYGGTAFVASLTLWLAVLTALKQL